MESDRWTHLSTAKLADELCAREAHRSMLVAEQAEIIAELDRRQAPAAAGCRTLQEWVTGRLDVDRHTARRLVSLSRLDDAELRRDLGDGEITADRALAEARLARTGAPDRVRRASRNWGVDGVHRLADRHRRFSRCDEQEAFARRYLTIQPNLEASLYKLDGLLPGLGGRAVADIVDARADRLPDHPDGRGTVAQRRADALVEVALDAADPRSRDSVGEEPPALLATVLVDALAASASGGEAGAEVVGGPRIGPNGLEAILCGGRVEIDVDAATPLGAGPAGHAVPPRLRRYVIARDGGRCTADGCRSRYRLQVHHVLPRSAGGTHDPANLTTQCWFHHMVVIHGRGFRIDPDSEPQRRRFLPPHGRQGRGPPLAD